MLLATGVMHRWVRHSRGIASLAYRPLGAPFSNLPLHVGPYAQRRETPLGEGILRVAGVDRYVQREYVDLVSGKSVDLYVGYWGYQNLGMGHGPEVCYPAAGWQVEGKAQERALRFPRAGTETTEAVMALHHFVRTEALGLERRAVGFVAVVDGQFRPSSRGTFLHRPPDSQNGDFLAHIIVSTSLEGAEWSESNRRIVDFMDRILPHVATCLFGREEEEDANAPGANEYGLTVPAERTDDARQ
ncbi:MAG: EpsI family protein [Planctomycetes bacterium]|nr:EpsI family protein [Planctomycetota bacterium]